MNAMATMTEIQVERYLIVFSRANTRLKHFSVPSQAIRSAYSLGGSDVARVVADENGAGSNCFLCRSAYIGRGEGEEEDVRGSESLERGSGGVIRL